MVPGEDKEGNVLTTVAATAAAAAAAAVLAAMHRWSLLRQEECATRTGIYQL